MQHVETVKLGEICEKIISGGTPSTERADFWNGDIPWITSADIQDFFTATPKKTITAKAGANILPAGNIIIVTRVGLGKLLVTDRDLAFSQDSQGLYLKPGMSNRYLAYALGREVQKFKTIGRGATIKGVTRDDLVNLEIPLPDLDTQRHIAAVLDRADALRQKDRQLLAYYEALPQAVFLEMFGDPVRNEKGWERGTIRDLVKEAKYGTSKPAEANGTYPYLRMNNITYSGQWNLTDLKYINLDDSEEVKYLAQKGDLLFNRTNSRELVGKTAVYKFDYPMAIAGYLVKARTNTRAVPEYISAYLNSKNGKGVLQNMCKSIIGMANINAQELQNISILIPPVELQSQYAEVVQEIEEHIQKINQQLGTSEALFQSLLHGYFGGNS